MASQQNRVEIARVLLNRWGDAADPNISDINGVTPLFVAVSLGRMDCVRALVEYGADINRPTKKGITPLMEASAVYAKYPDVFPFLMESGGDLKVMDQRGMTILMRAARKCNLKMIKMIYTHCATTWGCRFEIDEFVNMRDGKNGQTPLHFASKKGHENVVKYLVETVKVNVFVEDNRRRTARDYAIANGHKSIAHRLAQREDSNLSEYDSKIQHHCQLLVAGYCKRAESMMTGTGSALCRFSKEIIHLVFGYFYDDIIEDDRDGTHGSDHKLVFRKPMIFRVEKFGFTRLTMECWPVFKDYMNEIGMTVLQYAASLGHTESVRSLIDRMDDTDIKAQGAKALDIACHNGHHEVMEYLLNLSPDSFDDTVKNSTLHMACKSGNIDVVQVLLEHNGRESLDATKKEGQRTHLFLAASMGHYEIVKLLIARGANVDIKDSEGRTPLFIAAQNKHIRTVELLLKQMVCSEYP